MTPTNRILVEFQEEFRHPINQTARINCEPKKNNRFLVSFPSEMGDLKAFCVSSVLRPSWSNGIGWNDISIRLIDLVVPSTSKTLFEFVKWANKDDNRERILQFHIELLDPLGVVVERWEINALVSKIDFEELNYERDEPTMINMVLSPVVVDMVLLD